MHKFHVLAIIAGIAASVFLAYIILRSAKKADMKDGDVPDDRYPLW